MTAPALRTNLDYLRNLNFPTNAFINGEFHASREGRRFARVSPRDGATIAHVADCGARDVDDAVRSARHAFEDGRWSGQHPRTRRKALQRLARLVEEHRDELALLESFDMGKPVAEALAVDLRVTVQSYDFFAEAVDKLYDEVAPTDAETLATITREPLGVIGTVVPWNFPLMLASWKLAPALAAGNSVVLKPAEQSPLTALRFAELAAEAGLPDGVLNVVPGDGPVTGRALGTHPDVDAIAFTGSGEVGREFLRYSADSNLKQVSLELGGKNPQIVMPDAPDIPHLAREIATGCFFNQGEVCSAGSRLLVHRSRRDELVEAVSQAARDRTPADPIDPATRLGALVEKSHLERVRGFVNGAVDAGATLLAGGHQAREDTGGFYLEATVLDDVTPDMTIANQEVFGPVLAVLPFDTVEEAIALANGTDYGLAAAVWTRDISTAHRTARAIKAGTVWVNCYDASDVSVPFGGYRQSGFGRDKSLHAFDKVTQLKTTWVQL